MIETLKKATKICLDTNFIIYYVENHKYPNFTAKIDEIIDICLTESIEIYFSDMGVAECFFGAYKNKDENLVKLYNKFFYSFSLFKLVPITSLLTLKAAQLGAEKGLKLIDAIHFQSALESECSLFITNDLRFKSSHGIDILQLGTENV